MTEIKTGDRVKIAETIDRTRYHGSCGWAECMEPMLGTEGVVIRVLADRGWALVRNSLGAWFWQLDDLTLILKGHPHAALMLKFAQDAQTHKRPWDLWEVRFNSDSKWEDMIISPMWTPEYEYRRKPAKKTVLVNGIEVPAPETTAPADGTEYWIAYPAGRAYKAYVEVWGGEPLDCLLLSQGLVYLNKEDAIARAEAMLITKEAD